MTHSTLPFLERSFQFQLSPTSDKSLNMNLLAVKQDTISDPTDTLKG